MKYLSIYAPPYPFFLYSGDALYRPGDSHGHRSQTGVFDILFVEYGCLYMKEDEETYTVKKNEMLLLSPLNTHRAYKRCTEETYFHWLHFNTAVPANISSTLHKSAEPGTIKAHPGCSTENPEIYNIPVHQRMSDEIADKVYGNLRSLETYSINRYQKGAMRTKAPALQKDRLKQQEIFLDILSSIVIHEGNRTGSRIAHTIMQLILSDYARKLTLNDMAEAANCHPVHAIRCFQAEYETTPGKALITARLNEAEKLLKTTALTCEEISKTVGFSSPYYFNKVFKGQFQMPPLKYRKSVSEKVFDIP